MCDLYLITGCGYFTLRGSVTSLSFLMYMLMQPRLNLVLYWSFIVKWAFHPLTCGCLWAFAQHRSLKESFFPSFTWGPRLANFRNSDKTYCYTLDHQPCWTLYDLTKLYWKLSSATLGHWPIFLQYHCGVLLLCYYNSALNIDIVKDCVSNEVLGIQQTNKNTRIACLHVTNYYRRGRKM